MTIIFSAFPVPGARADMTPEQSAAWAAAQDCENSLPANKKTGNTPEKQKCWEAYNAIASAPDLSGFKPDPCAGKTGTDRLNCEEMHSKTDDGKKKAQTAYEKCMEEAKTKEDKEGCEASKKFSDELYDKQLEGYAQNLGLSEEEKKELAAQQKAAELNKACDIQGSYESYTASCYSCKVVGVLIDTFMEAGVKVKNTAQEAGIAILIIGAFLTMAFLGLKYVSSFAQVEPADIANTVLQTLFKIALAFFMIKFGFDFAVDRVISPIIAAGSDYGIGVIKAISSDNAFGLKAADFDGGGYSAYAGGPGQMDKAVVTAVMKLLKYVDSVTSTHMVVGNALACHAIRGGAFSINNGMIWFPDLWILIVGGFIWFVGFMLTLGCSFYLLDISFKIGLVLMIFPILIGLWPFGATKGRLSKALATVLKSAALLAFLAITVSYGMVMVANASNKTGIDGIQGVIDLITAGKTKEISELYAITGGTFILIIFAYLYAMKLVEATDKYYCSRFFEGDMGGNPMHQMATQGVDFVKQTAMKGAKTAGKAAKGAAAGAAGAAKFMTRDKDKKDEDKDKDKKGDGGAPEGQQQQGQPGGQNGGDAPGGGSGGSSGQGGEKK